MTMQINKAVCIAIATLSLASCTAQSNVGNLQFESIDKKDSVVLGEGTAFNMDFSISYPTSGDPELISWLNETLSKRFFGDEFKEKLPKSAINSFVEACKKDYIDEVGEFYADEVEKVKNGETTEIGVWYNYELSIQASPNLYKGSLLNYEIYNYTYTGGAHGYGAVSLCPIDLKAKKIIKYADLFTEANDEKITKLIIEQLKADLETNDLAETGYWVENISPSKNFGITEEGILFYYNQYEIAPYVMGPTAVTIPYKKLKGLINGEHPIIKSFL